MALSTMDRQVISRTKAALGILDTAGVPTVNEIGWVDAKHLVELALREGAAKKSFFALLERGPEGELTRADAIELLALIDKKLSADAADMASIAKSDAEPDEAPAPKAKAAAKTVPDRTLAAV